MNGKIILQHITNPVEGMKVVYGNEINPYRIGTYNGIVNVPHEKYPNHPWNGLHQVIDGESGHPSLAPWELSELKQLAVEYEEEGPIHEWVDKVTLPLHPEDYERAVGLIGQEVEFKTHEDADIFPDAKRWAKLSLSTPVEETWDNIKKEYFEATKDRKEGGTFYESEAFRWLKQHYLPPKRIK
jgi:hypothetical protein